jgi:hypothetical protein
MTDGVVIGGVVFSFAALVTSHVTLAFGLLFRPPRWRALVALAVPPLGAYWGMRETMRIRAALFCASAILYAFFRVLASR